MDAPHPQFGEAGPYAVHHDAETSRGRRCMPPARNLTWSSALRYRDYLNAQPRTVSASISLDTCG